MLSTEDPNAIIFATDESVSTLETRFSIVRDALVNDRPHLHDAIEHFLDALHDNLAEYTVQGPDQQPLDDRVISAIGKMKPLRDFFLEFVSLTVEKERSPEMHESIRAFLGAALAYKHAPRDVIHFNHLWCDHYRFLLREFFVGVIALLIANRQYDEVNRYLEAHYLFETNRGPQTANFLGFDAYIKSLDEFRARRLREERLSVAADLHKERCTLEFLSFDEVMQADFVLCMRSLLHHPKVLTRWFPRTLVYAQQFEKPGFDLFFSAQSQKQFAPVCKVLNVRDKGELLRRFEHASKECALVEWKIGDMPIPFKKYLGLSALATA